MPAASMVTANADPLVIGRLWALAARITDEEMLSAEVSG